MRTIIAAGFLCLAAVSVGGVSDPGTVELDNSPSLVGNEGGRFFDEQGNFPEGAEYAAQLYAGTNESRLVAVGRPVDFLRGESGGYFHGGTVAIPFIEGGAYAWVQVRAWETVGGASFEEAAKSWRWTGLSKSLYVMTGAPHAGGVPTPPALLRGLEYPGGPIIVRQPKPLTVRAGNVARLDVIASGGVVVDYRWYEGESGDFTRPSPGGTNATHVVSPTLTTAYWVRVMTSAGSTNSASANVNVVPGDSVLLNLKIREKLPTVIVDGPAGLTVKLQYGWALGVPAWADFARVVLEAQAIAVVDSNAVGSPVRIYRGMVLP